jgi:hypothetical protein
MVGTIGSDFAVTWSWDTTNSTLDSAYMPKQ